MTSSSDTTPAMSADTPESVAARLDEITARHVKTTDGTWRASGGYLTTRSNISSTIYHLDELGQDGPSSRYQAIPFYRREDAAFCAAAHKDVPWLVDLARAQAEELVRMSEGAHEMDKECDRLLARATQAEAALAASEERVRAMREALIGAADLAWEDTNNVRFDSTVLFGKGYDFEPLELMRQEFHCRTGSWVVWPNSVGGQKKWSAYGGPDGLMWFERFDTESAAKDAVIRQVARTCPDHPAVIARTALSTVDATAAPGREGSDHG